jgi:hypothetical protein
MNEGGMLVKKFWTARLSDRTTRSVEILKTSDGLIDAGVFMVQGKQDPTFTQLHQFFN